MTTRSQIKSKNSSPNRSDLLLMIKYLKSEHDFDLGAIKYVFKLKRLLKVFTYRDIEFNFTGRAK